MSTSNTSIEAFETNEVVYEEEGQVAILTFNRPRVLNAMTFGMYEALYEVCERVDSDESIRVLVLKGAGEAAFVTGTDISLFQTFSGPEDVLAYEERIERVVARLEEVKKPVIAALNGFTVAGGAIIAAVADLRIATPSLQFGIPIAHTLGNCLSIRNYARLIDLLGPARTKELLFTAHLIEADEALASGLVNEIVEEEELEERVKQVAEIVASNAPLTLQVTKEAISRILAHHRSEVNDDLILKCYMSKDFKEGVDAFLNKRRPHWQGR
ncbi:MAG: enoyl-CoA hydratase/isomerase family protein [Chloroflexota bacterium]|nr:enoyl-CoA hydratase/isomerase family protein [Chloroflexota bacterium]